MTHIQSRLPLPRPAARTGMLVLLISVLFAILLPHNAHAVNVVKTVSDEDRLQAQDTLGLYQVRLLGDARAEAVSSEAAASFGGGLEYATLRWTLAFTVRTGTDDGILDDSKAVGRFVLSPTSFGRPSYDLDARWFPWTKFKTFTGTKPQIGFRTYFQGSETTWNITHTDGQREGIRGNVNAFGLGAGGRLVFVSDDTNYIDMQGFIGPAFRFIGGNIALDGNIADPTPPLEHALNTRQRVHFGIDLASLSMRIRSLLVGFNLSWFPGTKVLGLSDLQYVAGVQLREQPARQMRATEDRGLRGALVRLLQRPPTKCRPGGRHLSCV